MVIKETFHLAPEKAARLYWTPGYIKLSRQIWDNFMQTGEISEGIRHLGNCQARWGISRRCAESVLTGEGTFELADSTVTIIRPVIEE